MAQRLGDHAAGVHEPGQIVGTGPPAAGEYGVEFGVQTALRLWMAGQQAEGVGQTERRGLDAREQQRDQVVVDLLVGDRRLPGLAARGRQQDLQHVVVGGAASAPLRDRGVDDGVHPGYGTPIATVGAGGEPERGVDRYDRADEQAADDDGETVPHLGGGRVVERAGEEDAADHPCRQRHHRLTDGHLLPGRPGAARRLRLLGDQLRVSGGMGGTEARLQQPSLVPVRLVRAGDETVAHQCPEPVEERAPLVEGARIPEHLMGQLRMAHHPGALRAQSSLDQISVRGQRTEKRQRMTEQSDTVTEQWEYAWSSTCPPHSFLFRRSTTHGNLLPGVTRELDGRVTDLTLETVLPSSTGARFRETFLQRGAKEHGEAKAARRSRMKHSTNGLGRHVR